MFLITGCADAEELLQVPKLPSQYEQIQEILNNEFEDYSLITPVKGPIQESVILKNIYGDELKEAICLIRDLNKNRLSIIVLESIDNQWKINSQLTNVGYDINQFEFTDFNGDNIFEFVIGWKGGTNLDKGISVYTFQKGSYKEIFRENYSIYTLVDLNEDFTEELFLVKLDKSKDISQGILYDFNEKNQLIYYIDEVEMDGYINGYDNIISGNIGNNQKGILIDTIVGADASYTDLVIYNDGELINVFYNDMWKYTDLTYRLYSKQSKDKDEDGVLEIPLVREIEESKAFDHNTKQLMTTWMEWDGKRGLKFDFESYESEKDYFSINLPDTWGENGSVAVDHNNYSFKYVSKENNDNITVFQIFVITQEQFTENKDVLLSEKGYKIINRKFNKIYLAKINNLDYQITFEYLKEEFKITR